MKLNVICRIGKLNVKEIKKKNMKSNMKKKTVKK